jgi:hypothetical protein
VLERRNGIVTKIPIGRHENNTLEFKQKESLDHPEVIARAIVGMLNSNGGDVWIGIKEEAGTAVSIEPIDDPEKARCSLRDYLMDVLEPAPLDREIDISTEKVESGLDVLRVQVRQSDERKPYALLKGGGRYFHIRAGDRIRPMSREEIFPPRAHMSRRNTSLADAIDLLRKEKEKHRQAGKSIYWIALKPPHDMTIDIQNPGIRVFLKDAALTGNRPHGWNFINPYGEPIVRRGRLVHGEQTGQSIDVREDGTLSLSIDIESLTHSGKENEIYPYALIEYPVALFRLASRLYPIQEAAGSNKVLADAALIGIRGWKLNPYSPRSIHFQHPRNMSGAWTESRDLIWERPLQFSEKEIAEEPDWCGFRLVRRIYEAFGYFEDQIPVEFDRSKRRLIIPD